MEMAMRVKQFGQKKHSENQKEQEGNLGQKGAHLERQRKSELSNMGEVSRESDSSTMSASCAASGEDSPGA
jgi:hypothetical protein